MVLQYDIIMGDYNLMQLYTPRIRKSLNILINNTQNRNVVDSPIALRRLGVIRVHNWHYIESEFARECIIFLFLL